MKGRMVVYMSESFSFEKVDPKTGAIQKAVLWKQPWDLDQGPGVRVLQGETVSSNQADIVAAGDYEVDWYLEKNRKGFLEVRVLSRRPVAGSLKAAG